MDKSNTVTTEKKKSKKLTLDKIIGGEQPQTDDNSGRVYAFPKSCKAGQHSNAPITPGRPLQA